MQIVDGIHWVQGVRANCYVVLEGSDLTLIDTGMPRNAKKIMKYVAETLGRKPSDVKTIIVTHAHADHTGGLAELVKLTGAKVAVHSDDANYVSGDTAPLSPKGGMGFLFKVLSPITKSKSVKPDMILKENDNVGGLSVIHIPGHTPGSIALYDASKNVLFSGDTLTYSDGRIHGPVEAFSHDVELAAKSVEKLRKFAFDIMLPGHGEPLTGGAAEKMKELKP